MTTHQHADLYFCMWHGPFPKKIKIFMWELSHGCICTVEVLQKKGSLDLFLSKLVCLLPKRLWILAHHLHHMSADTFGNIILSAFNWHLAISRDMTCILEVILNGHPYGKEKEITWNYFIREHFFTIFGWKEIIVSLKARPLVFRSCFCKSISFFLIKLHIP